MESQPVAPEASATHGLYERHAAKIHGYCLHQLGSREEAEDAVQTTFMNAFRALGRGVVPEAEAAWLFKIAENVCLSRRRSSWRRNRIESPADFEVIEEVVPGPNRQRDELIGIEDALAAMPGQQRRAILLREWQGLSYSEISAELELSQSAVETLIFRARRSLAQGLTEPKRVRPQRRFRRVLELTTCAAVTAAAGTAAPSERPPAPRCAPSARQSASSSAPSRRRPASSGVLEQKAARAERRAEQKAAGSSAVPSGRQSRRRGRPTGPTCGRSGRPTRRRSAPSARPTRWSAGPNGRPTAPSAEPSAAAHESSSSEPAHRRRARLHSDRPRPT